MDDVVLPGGVGDGQYSGHVMQCQHQKHQEAQQVAPDVHRLIGQDEKAEDEDVKDHNHDFT